MKDLSTGCDALTTGAGRAAVIFDGGFLAV